MRIASFTFAIALVTILAFTTLNKARATQEQTQAQPVTSLPSVQPLFEEFRLFGRWAIDCEKPAAPDNPHVIVTAPAPQWVQEEHDLGPIYAINRYRVLSAERMSPTRLSVEVLFQPDGSQEERQRIIFSVDKNTRRTLFNQPKDGAVRVKDGIVVAGGVKTPLLTKCKP